MKLQRPVLLFVLLFSFSFVGNSQETRKTLKHKADSILNARGEIAFTFEIMSREEIARFTKMLSIDNVNGNKVVAYASKKQFRNFYRTKRAFTLLPLPAEIPKNLLKEEAQLTPAVITSWNDYPTYSGYDSAMNAFQSSYPALCRMFSIATLPSGRKLLFLKITSNVDVRGNKPQFLYTSTIHGNEPTGYVTLLHLIDYLLAGYGSDPRVTYLLDNIELYVNPLANPDGCYAGGNSTVYNATRGNANHVDLNRNYPDPQAGAHPDGHAYQPETQAFMRLADSLNFTMSANFHTGAEVFNYPWDTWSMVHADDDWWSRMGIQYADTVHANSSSGYFTDLFSGTHPGVTNGYAWYQVTGGRQDYMTYFKHCRECTIELSSASIPAANSLLNFWNYNYRSLLNYMEQSLFGIRGLVTDSCSGDPLHAKVYITGHDHDSSEVYSNLPVGDYHRLLFSGIYTLTFSSPGYISKTIQNVHVSNDSTTLIDVPLCPVPPSISASALPTMTCPGPVQFTGSTASAGWLWDFGDGITSALQNPLHTYASSGTFTVKYFTTNCIGTDSVILNNYITIYPVQTLPVISLANDTLFSSEPNGNQWYFNGSEIPGATAAYYVPLSNGDYSVTASNTYGCVSDTSGVFSYLSTGTRAPDVQASLITIFPNPCKETITIQLFRPGKDYTLDIINMLGQTVQTVQLNSSVCTIDISALPAAPYSVRCRSIESTSIQRLQKQ